MRKGGGGLALAASYPLLPPPPIHLIAVNYDVNWGGGTEAGAF